MNLKMTLFNWSQKKNLKKLLNKKKNNINRKLKK